MTRDLPKPQDTDFLLDTVWKDINARFAAVVGMLPSALDLIRELPEIAIRRTNCATVTARVRVDSFGDIVVELGDPFLSKLIDSIRRIEETEITGLFSVNSTRSWLVPTVDDIRSAIFGIAEQFLIHHELFHLLSGHVGHAVASKEGSLGIDEAAIAAAPGSSSNHDHAFPSGLGGNALFLFRELEADDTALQFLVDRCLLEDLGNILPNVAGKSISETAGTDRVLAFRFLLIAVWQVVFLLQELGDRSKPSSTHPWPATRLLSLLFTLFPYYVENVSIAEDELGQSFAKLSDDSVEPAIEYIREVVGPAMKFILAQADGDDVADRYRAEKYSESDLFTDILVDLKGLMFDEEVRTLGGRQFDALRRRRRELGAVFEPFRFAAFS